jgi:hypothetical protein
MPKSLSLFTWCRRGDSNPHGFPHHPLNGILLNFLPCASLEIVYWRKDRTDSPVIVSLAYNIKIAPIDETTIFAEGRPKTARGPEKSAPFVHGKMPVSRDA